ncbi:hypothetical protein KUM39_24485 [Streptomyces sp. J2-1]|uniref:hypothetical protein n=1 Tax=Streptomyces corallincola TaxID=2851888 RepID=UPI001C38B8C2|nr:hypothetical protein [Streptomyces corallincola]MBV2357485.1 hypothetical protein [Streptomyces corallincola]
MHPAAHLPHLDLTDMQWQLLARLSDGPLPDPSDRPAFTRALAVDGTDADLARDALPTLRWMKLVVVTGEALRLTDLGAAMHFRAVYEAAELRLSEVARLAEAGGAKDPGFAQAVRMLSDGSRTLAEALADLGRG